jgi:hypothetical protein
MVATGVINYTLGSVAKPGKAAGTFGQSRAYAQGSLTDLFFSPTPAHANGKTYSCTKLPEYMQNILNQGGLIASLNREEE